MLVEEGLVALDDSASRWVPWVRPDVQLHHLLSHSSGIDATGAARAEERILDFASHVQVRPDASLEVAETIAVTAEGNRIRHGIFRDFPTRYRDRDGRERRVGFRVLAVTRDGRRRWLAC